MSDTSRAPTLCQPPFRQGGRDISAPRPCEIYPFHPPALFTPNIKNNFYIYTKLFQLFLPCGINQVRWDLHLLFTHSLHVHFAQYVVRIGTRYSGTLPLKLDTDALPVNYSLPLWEEPSTVPATFWQSSITDPFWVHHHLAYGWRAGNLNWPIRIQRAGKILVSWRQVNKSGKALKSSLFSHWKWKYICTKSDLQFQNPYQIVKSEKYDKFCASSC